LICSFKKIVYPHSVTDAENGSYIANRRIDGGVHGSGSVQTAFKRRNCARQMLVSYTARLPFELNMLFSGFDIR